MASLIIASARSGTTSQTIRSMTSLDAPMIAVRSMSSVMAAGADAAADAAGSTGAVTTGGGSAGAGSNEGATTGGASTGRIDSSKLTTSGRDVSCRPAASGGMPANETGSSA